MAGKSKKEMHPFIEKIMHNRNCTNLSELAREADVPLMTLRRLAFYGGLPQNKEAAEEIANALGMTYAQLISGLASTGVRVHKYGGELLVHGQLMLRHKQA
jgi:hypothetical protein